MKKREEFLRICLEREISIDTALMMSHPMRGMTEEQKEERAEFLTEIIKSSKTKSENLQKLQIQKLL